MKKSLVALGLMASVGMAFAVDVGLRFGKSYQANQTTAGVVLSQDFDNFTGELAFDRTLTGPWVDRYSLVGGYNLAAPYGVTVTPKVGIGYVRFPGGLDGEVALLGVSASIPLTKAVSFAVEYQYQYGRTSIASQNGNTVFGTLNYSF